jgi:hypothetical protein
MRLRPLWRFPSVLKKWSVEMRFGQGRLCAIDLLARDKTHVVITLAIGSKSLQKVPTGDCVLA